VGPAVTSCNFDYRIADNLVIEVKLECPAGQIALQSSCSNGNPLPASSIGWMVSYETFENIVRCFIRVPPELKSLSVAASATCTELAFIAPGGAALAGPLSISSIEAFEAKFEG
jgi:hypothetical protein